MNRHPLARFSLEEIEERTEWAFAKLQPDLFLHGGQDRYVLIRDALQTFVGNDLPGKIHRALLTGQARSLRTVQLLAMRGYPQDTAAVARVALERAFQQAFIGRDPDRAARWHGHSDEVHTFEQHWNCVNAWVRQQFAGDPAEIQKHLDAERELYRDLSAYTHGNPAVTKGVDLRLIERAAVLTPMSTFTARGFVQCALIFLSTLRSAEIALHAMVSSHAQTERDAKSWTRRISALTAKRAGIEQGIRGHEQTAETWARLEARVQEAIRSAAAR